MEFWIIQVMQPWTFLWMPWWTCLHLSVGYCGKSKTAKSIRMPVFKFLKQVYSKLSSAINTLVMLKDIERCNIVTIRCNPKMTNEVRHVFIFVCPVDILFVDAFSNVWPFCLVDRVSLTPFSAFFVGFVRLFLIYFGYKLLMSSIYCKYWLSSMAYIFFFYLL